jgi:hypothetical protein
MIYKVECWYEDFKYWLMGHKEDLTEWILKKEKTLSGFFLFLYAAYGCILLINSIVVLYLTYDIYLPELKEIYSLLLRHFEFWESWDYSEIVDAKIRADHLMKFFDYFMKPTDPRYEKVKFLYKRICELYEFFQSPEFDKTIKK